jgi:hypothetical protein
MTVTSIADAIGWVTVKNEHGTRTIPLASAEGFEAASRAWLRCGGT